MAINSKDIETLWQRYSAEGVGKGISVAQYFESNGVPYLCSMKSGINFLQNTKIHWVKMGIEISASLMLYHNRQSDVDKVMASVRPSVAEKNELKRYFINSYNHKSLVELGRVYQEIIFFHITFGFSERNTYLCSHISFN